MRYSGFLILPASILFATPVAAQTLWQDLMVGTPKQMVEAAHPDKTVELTAECMAKISFGYSKNDALMEVNLFANKAVFGKKSEWDRAISCSETVEASLVSKYGSPHSTDIESTKVGAFTSVSDVSIWVKDGVIIKYNSKRVASQRGPVWGVAYTAIPSPKIIAPNAASKL